MANFQFLHSFIRYNAFLAVFIFHFCLVNIFVHLCKLTFDIPEAHLELIQSHTIRRLGNTSTCPYYAFRYITKSASAEGQV